jgi:hypothetical protein
MKLTGLVVALLLFVSCGTPPPPYKEFKAYSRSPVGYASIQLSEHAFWVTAVQTGPGYTSRLADYALMRSAELTREAGFTHFQVVSGADTAAELRPPYRVVEPSLWNVIICHDGTPVAEGESFVASEVIARVSEKHEITTRAR